MIAWLVSINTDGCNVVLRFIKFSFSTKGSVLIHRILESVTSRFSTNEPSWFLYGFICYLERPLSQHKTIKLFSGFLSQFVPASVSIKLQQNMYQ